MNSVRDLYTLADLNAEVAAMGGDPASTTFIADGWPVFHHGAPAVVREDGALVVVMAGYGEWDE